MIFRLVTVKLKLTTISFGKTFLIDNSSYVMIRVYIFGLKLTNLCLKCNFGANNLHCVFKLFAQIFGSINISIKLIKWSTTFQRVQFDSFLLNRDRFAKTWLWWWFLSSIFITNSDKCLGFIFKEFLKKFSKFTIYLNIDVSSTFLLFDDWPLFQICRS